MTTLFLNMDTYRNVEFRLTGLSLGKLKKFSEIRSAMCKRDYDSVFYISLDHGGIKGKAAIDSKTAKISLEYLIHLLRELKETIPFDKIKIEGHYEVTGEKLYKLLTTAT